MALLQPVLKMTAAALLGAAVANFVMAFGDWTSGPTWPNIGIFGSAGAVALTVYGAVAGALGVAEIRTVANKIARRLR